MSRQTGGLLLISNSTNPGEGYLDHCADVLSGHFEGAKQIAFVPYAMADLDGYAEMARRRFEKLGLKMISVHEGDPVQAVSQSDGFFVGGGNSFRLLARVRSLGMIEAIRKRVGEGVPYAGASAGSNLAGPSIKTTNDMPIVDSGGLDALDLFRYQINPHYVDRDPDVAHGGETRAQRIAEFHEENETPVIGLYEGSLLIHRDFETTLRGNRGAVLFLRGAQPLAMSDGAIVERIIARKPDNASSEQTL